MHWLFTDSGWFVWQVVYTKACMRDSTTRKWVWQSTRHRWHWVAGGRRNEPNSDDLQASHNYDGISLWPSKEVWSAWKREHVKIRDANITNRVEHRVALAVSLAQDNVIIITRVHWPSLSQSQLHHWVRGVNEPDKQGNRNKGWGKQSNTPAFLLQQEIPIWRQREGLIPEIIHQAKRPIHFCKYLSVFCNLIIKLNFEGQILGTVKLQKTPRSLQIHLRLLFHWYWKLH